MLTQQNPKVEIGARAQPDQLAHKAPPVLWAQRVSQANSVRVVTRDRLVQQGGTEQLDHEAPEVFQAWSAKQDLEAQRAKMGLMEQ